MREVPIQVSSNLGDVCIEPRSGVVKVFGETVSGYKLQNAGMHGKVFDQAACAPFQQPIAPTLDKKAEMLMWIGEYGTQHIQVCTNPMCLSIKAALDAGTITEQEVLDFKKASVVNFKFPDDSPF